MSKKHQRSSDLKKVKALAIDIFGTVADWRGSIVKEGKILRRSVDWGAFADQWLTGYRSRVEQVRTGQRPWANLDALLDEAFVELVEAFKLSDIKKEKLDHFGHVWHRLRVWPDCLPGLRRLRKSFIVGTLSNANTILLTDMARNASLHWDCVLCAELVKRYKPEPEPYLLAVEGLGLHPEQVMYVAAHKWDLSAGAEKAHMKTAFIPRPKEIPGNSDISPDPSYDINAEDFEDLADQLGA
jgi:2-haloacid dehalogenase